MANRLATESSPYLVQHKDNPVAWWPWGAEAFAEARRLDKPVFVSIGYAACHWCHVMAHESFEDAATAAVMNDLFVNVKVDREERPDVDAIYMNAIQVMGEGGGWPLSAFCTPEGKPFFLGTYFPPTEKYGRPSFLQVLQAMSDAWKSQRDQVLENVDALLDGLQRVDAHYRKGAAQGEMAALNRSLLITAGRQVAQRCDPKQGGLSGAPKFPSSSTHDLLARAGRFEFGQPAREAYLTWARAMARGGIYDHLGGGFARYSVDAAWLVPHFEKMLYDNGQLLGVFAEAYAMTGDDELARVIPETVAWLEREMSDRAGGLYASQDADSEGEEGKFYVWTPAQVAAVVGPIDALHVCKAYGITDQGNFEHHGTTVLSRVTPRGAASDEAHLDELRARLFAARSKRIWPGTDDKVLAGWNGLAVSGLLKAWRATGHAPARALAVRVGQFLVGKMLDGDRLWRVYKDGVVKLDGTVDDYAFVAAAFLDLAEATGDASWWTRGAALVAQIRARFVEDAGGVVVFYMSAADESALLVHRPESHHDGAIPSGAAVAVECLVRLGHVAGDAAALELAERYLVQRLGSAGATAGAAAFAQSRLLAALDLYLHGQTLVVTGGRDRDRLVEAARRAYAPTLMLAGPWASEDVLAGKTDGAAGQARAFLCRGQTCSAPVDTTGELAELLTKA